jgi:hypothetical protein
LMQMETLLARDMKFANSREPTSLALEFGLRMAG